MRPYHNRSVAPGKSSPPGWRVVADADFFDVRITPMNPSCRFLVQVLEKHCRMNPFCWCSNSTLTAETGMESRTLQQALAKLDGEWITCIYSDPKKRHRLGIIMRRRVGPGTPYADTPERLAEVESAVRAGWRSDEFDPSYWMDRLGFSERGNPRSPEIVTESCARKTALNERQNRRSPVRGKPRQNNDVVVKKEELKKEAGPELSNDNDKRPNPPPVIPHDVAALQQALEAKRAWLARERQGETQPAPMPLDRAMADVRQMHSMANEPFNAGPGDMARFASAGHRDFRAALDDGQRARLDLLSPGKQAMILAPHAARFDPALLSLAVREIETSRAVADQVVGPESTEDLVRRVGGGDPGSVATLAEALCQDLGGAEDRKRWGALHALAEQLHQGAVSADAVLDSLRQSRNPACERPGAVFTSALKVHGWRPG